MRKKKKLNVSESVSQQLANKQFLDFYLDGEAGFLALLNQVVESAGSSFRAVSLIRMESIYFLLRGDNGEYLIASLSQNEFAKDPHE